MKCAPVYAASWGWLLCTSVAQAGSPCDGAMLSHLLPYAGSYEGRRLIGEAAIADPIANLLGERLGALRMNLNVAGPVELRACTLVVEGNAPHRGGEEHAIFALNLYTGSISAGILSAGRITLFSVERRYGDLPVSIRDWAAVASLGFEARTRPPEGVHLGPGIR